MFGLSYCGRAVRGDDYEVDLIEVCFVVSAASYGSLLEIIAREW